MGLHDRIPPSAADYDAYKTRFSNWGRWGADDELGTLNHITDVTRRAAAALVRDGHCVSLARPIDTQAGPRNPYPAHHLASVGPAGGFADYIGLFFHGFSQTHVDALSHIPTIDGHFYNGRPIGSALAHLTLPEGLTCGIQHWRQGIVTRGVLYDIPRLRGTECVTAGAPVHGWELLEAAKAQGVEPRPGDAVCIRSGRDEWFAVHPEATGWSAPAGVHASVCEFLHQTDAALLCWDMLDAPEADQGIPNPFPIDTPVHVHYITIPYMGMPLVDNADFRALARVCADRGRYEFQFVVAPLVIEGGTGSPVNPITVF